MRTLTHLTKALDPTRPVVATDGWETIGGDIIAVHDYEQDPAALQARWTGDLEQRAPAAEAHSRP